MMSSKQKRSEIKRLLLRLTDGNRRVFMRLYSPDDLDKDINLVVDELSTKQLDYAFSQVQKTYYQLFDILSR